MPTPSWSAIGTVLADDPLLTVRLPGLEERSPVRVVLDGRLRTAPACRRFVTGAGLVPTWIVAADTAPVASQARGSSATGVELVRARRRRMTAGHLDGPAGGDAAGGARRHPRLSSEGGPSLADCFARLDRRDEVVVSTRSPPARAARGRPAIGVADAARHGRSRPSRTRPTSAVGDGGGDQMGCVREGVSVT